MIIQYNNLVLCCQVFFFFFYNHHSFFVLGLSKSGFHTWWDTTTSKKYIPYLLWQLIKFLLRGFVGRNFTTVWLKITTLENVICLENRYNGCTYNTQLALCRNEKNNIVNSISIHVSHCWLRTVIPTMMTDY